MDVASNVRRQFRRWWVAGLFVIVGALAGLAYGLLRPPVYSAEAYVAVVAQDRGDTTAVNYAQAYARVADSGDALAAAVTQAGGRYTPAELRRSVRVSSSPDAPLIEITGSAGRADRAADIANLMSDALIASTNRRSSDTRMKLVVLSAAAPPVEPASPRPVIDIAIGVAAGVLLAGLALLGGRARTAGQAPTPGLKRWIGTAAVAGSTESDSPAQDNGGTKETEQNRTANDRNRRRQSPAKR